MSTQHNKSVVTYDKFLNPPSEYGPVPWWLWTGKIEEKTLSNQMKSMQKMGISEFFIFPVYGLEIVFNSKEYFKKVDFVLKQCKKLGMKAWIYDDLNWPSGIGAGFVLKNNPEAKGLILTFASMTISGRGNYELPLQGQMVEAFLIEESGKYKRLDGIDITGDSKGKTIGWENRSNKKGIFAIFAVDIAVPVLPSATGTHWTWNQEGYLDTLDSQAVKKFIEFCYEPYAKQFSKHLGNIIPGFFTDEPAAMHPRTLMADHPRALPFSHKFFKEFKKTWGYDLTSKLPELIWDVGNYARTRYHYWLLVTTLFSKNYHGQIAGWCEKHNLKLTAHQGGEETFFHEVLFNGEMFSALKRVQIPGMDMLGQNSGAGNNANKGFIHAAKMLSGTARYSGAERVMVESSMVSPYSISPAIMKKIVAWESAMGMNLINDAGFPASLKGFVKRSGTGKAFCALWNRYYKMLADFIRRTSYIAANSNPTGEIAVLYPTTGMRCLFNGKVYSNYLPRYYTSPLFKQSLQYIYPRKGDISFKNFQMLQRSIHSLSEALVSKHWSYEYIFESALNEAAISKGTLSIRDAGYRLIIMPYIGAFTKTAFEKIKEFILSGGILLLTGDFPKLTPDNNWDIESAFRKIISNPNVFLLNYKSKKKLPESIDSFLKKHLFKPFDIKGNNSEQIITSHKSLKNTDIFFLANQLENEVEAEIVINVDGKIEYWNPEDGMRYSSASITKGNSRYKFAPLESFYIICRRSSKTDFLPKLEDNFLKFQKVKFEIPLPKLWKFRTEKPNTLLLDPFFKADPENIGLKEKWHLDSNCRDWEHLNYGCRRIPLDPDSLKWYWLKSHIYLSHTPHNLGIVLDSCNHREVYINGKKAKFGSQVEVYDSENALFPIAHLVKLGRNTIAIKGSPSSYYSKKANGISNAFPVIRPYYTEPVILYGAFKVRYRNKVWTIEKEGNKIGIGSWHEKGYPNYSGTATYECKVDIPAFRGKAWLQIDNLSDCMEVLINDNFVGMRAWPPYSIEITKFLTAGINKITIKVTKGLGNLLRWHFWGNEVDELTPAGILGDVKIKIV